MSLETCRVNKKIGNKYYQSCISLLFIYSLVHRSTCFGHCCAHHQEPFFHCTCSLCSPFDVRFDVASSLVQVLVMLSLYDVGVVFYLILSILKMHGTKNMKFINACSSQIYFSLCMIVVKGFLCLLSQVSPTWTLLFTR
jgi:hypothetical protein